MKTLIIIITFLIPTFCGITEMVELDFLFGVGIILQFIWSTILLIHILSDEGIFSFD
jgi:hypothetical protein